MKFKQDIKQKNADIFKQHIGHVITYYEYDVFQSGKLIRVSTDQYGVCLWLEGKPFPKMIYDQSARRCECMD